MSDAAQIVLTQQPDGGFDLTCRDCGASARVDRDESFIGQVRLFRSRHRHDEDTPTEDR